MIEEDVQMLERSRAGVATQIAGAREEMARLSDHLQRLEHEARLLDELLRLRSGTTPKGSASGEALGTEAGLRDASSGRGAVSEAVVEMLRTAGKPLHIQELYAQARDRGLPLPGKAEPANLISVIRAHPEIARPVRGMYGLREWGIEDYASGEVQRPARRRPPAGRRQRTKRVA